MSRVICDISVSLDGYVTGPNDSREKPFGDGAETLHNWLSDTATDADHELLQGYLDDVGAIVMGRKSFDKNEAEGGWGDVGPYGATPCFVVTHNAPDRAYPPVFTFITDGVEAAIDQAKHAAGEQAVALHGATIMQQALPLGLVDELRLHVVAVLVGDGTPLFGHLTNAAELRRTNVVVTPAATHLRYAIGRDE